MRAEPEPRPGEREARGQARAVPAADFRPARPRSTPQDEPGTHREEKARPGVETPPRPGSPRPGRRAALTLPRSRLTRSQSNSISSPVPEPGGRTPAPGPSATPVPGRRPPRTKPPERAKAPPLPRLESHPRSTRGAALRSGRESIHRCSVSPERRQKRVREPRPGRLEANLGTSVTRGRGRTREAVREVEAALAVLEEFLGCVKFSSIQKDQDRIL